MNAHVIRRNPAPFRHRALCGARITGNAPHGSPLCPGCADLLPHGIPQPVAIASPPAAAIVILPPAAAGFLPAAS